MDSLGVWDSMRLEHCHTRDVNTGKITGRVEYRDLTYTDGTPDKTKLTPINIKEVDTCLAFRTKTAQNS